MPLQIQNQNSTAHGYFYTPAHETLSSMAGNNYLLGNIMSMGDSSPQILEITTLPNYRLRAPIKITIQPDNGGWLAEAASLFLYAYGDTYIEALLKIRREVESLYHDLMEDDNFSDSWLAIKSLLAKIVESHG